MGKAFLCTFPLGDNFALNVTYSRVGKAQAFQFFYLVPVLSLLFGGFTLHALRPLAVTLCRVSVTPEQGNLISRKIGSDGLRILSVHGAAGECQSR